MSPTLKDLRRLGPVSCACGEHDDILGYYEPTIADIVEVLKNEGAEEKWWCQVAPGNTSCAPGREWQIHTSAKRHAECGLVLVFRLDEEE